MTALSSVESRFRRDRIPFIGGLVADVVGGIVRDGGSDMVR